MNVCYKCNAEITESEYVSRSDSCPQCGFDLRCCKNCHFYDSGAYNECSEPQAERVVDKEKSNFCDYFKFSDSGSGTSNGGPTLQKKKNPLDDLFKK